MVAQVNYSHTVNEEAPTHEAVHIGPHRTIHLPLAAFVGKTRAYCVDWRGNGGRHDATYNEDFLALRAIRALRSYRFCANIRPGAPLIVRGKDGQGDWQVAQMLRSDGLWEVGAVRVTGKECESKVFTPDLLDFAAWVEHLS